MATGGIETARLERVEGEVSTIRNEMAGLKADMRSFGEILGRIEGAVAKAHERQDQKEVQSRPNIVAVSSVLVSIIFTLVTGAWLVGGQLARLDERSNHRASEIAQVVSDIRRIDAQRGAAQ